MKTTKNEPIPKVVVTVPHRILDMVLINHVNHRFIVPHDYELPDYMDDYGMFSFPVLTQEQPVVVNLSHVTFMHITEERISTDPSVSDRPYGVFGL